MILTSIEIYGQEPPPRPPTIPPGIPEPPPRPLIVSVSLLQNLNFGAFYHQNAGGTVIIYPDGSRSATGDVVLINMGFSFSPGLFDVAAYPGTLVSILDSPDATLSCLCGGTLTLRIRQADSYPTIITTVPPASTQVKVGGTLYVSNSPANPPGDYSGTFFVTFVQE